MKAPLVVSLFALALPIGLFAQWPDADPFQVNYAANLNIGDSALNFTNSGASGGSICLNLYVFSPDEQEQTCCSCPLSPNSLWSAALLQDLLNNPLTGGTGSYLRNPANHNSAVVKALATNNLAACGTATAASTVTGDQLVPGLIAWGTHYHITAIGTPAITETEFSHGTLSAAELSRITSFCAFAIANGSGAGICPGCRAGGLVQTSSLTTKLGQ